LAPQTDSKHTTSAFLQTTSEYPNFPAMFPLPHQKAVNMKIIPANWLGLEVVSAVFLALGWIVVVIRSIVRYQKKLFWFDDYLMAISLVTQFLDIYTTRTDFACRYHIPSLASGQS
jgi:uncharacterized membrane protein YozB (DUF420 family)